MMAASSELAAPSKTAADAELIQKMGDAVGSALAARCVVLFGSRARGDNHVRSDIDIAVIIDQTKLNAQERYDLREQAHSVAVDVADGHFRRIDLIVWTESEYRAKKRSTNHVAGRAWREGRILYGRHETLPGEEIVSELGNARELMRMSRRQITALFGMVSDDETFSENIFGFHAQRATELALKAWIGLVGKQYERTHSLADLITVLNDAGDADMRLYAHLASLTPYAVRYVYEEIENPTMDRRYIADEVNALADLVGSLLQQAEEDTLFG